MSRESLIFLLVVLVVWGLSVAARWLQEEIERSTANEIEFKTVTESPILNTELTSRPEILGKLETTKILPSSTLQQEKQRSQKKISSQLRFDSAQTMRQGIILMAVLGPCRANDPISTIRYF